MENLPAIDWASYMPVLINLLQAIGILILGWLISGWAGRVIRKRLGSNNGLRVNDTLRPLIATSVKYAIMLAAFYTALTSAGIPAASLLAVLGAAGLAIALSVQGTLANIAAGIMLIFLRIIKVGEYIATPGFEGTVLEIGLFTSQIKAPNGVLLTVPNAQIWSSRVTNYSRFSERRIDINLALSRDNDLGAAVKTVQGALSKNPHVIKKDASSIVLTTIDANSATVQARCWISTEDVRGHTSEISIDLHNALRAGGYKLPPVMATQPA